MYTERGPARKKSRERGYAPGEVRRLDAKAVRQSLITVRLGTDSVNPFRRQIYKSLVSVALKTQNRTEKRLLRV